MLKKGEHIEGTPSELQELLNQEAEANAFFESLSKSYKQGYCDWVGSAKQEDTRKIRADKAMIMLRNKQKTLKT
ncbi:MAG: YdeI/OmpD-associated family protein [Mucilaginibacter sp.]